MALKLTMERIPAPFASMYEKACRLVVEPYYRRVAEEVVSTFRKGRLLDLGTGPGYLPIEIAKKAPRVMVVGVDLSRPFIRMARKQAMKIGLAHRVRFEVGDAKKLRFDEGSFDGIISTGMLHMLKDPVRMLKECHRVLKPGGEGWIYDPARVSSQIDKRRWKDSFTPVERWVFPLLAMYARINPPHAYTREKLAAMMRSASFQDFTLQEHDGEWKIRMRKEEAQT